MRVREKVRGEGIGKSILRNMRNMRKRAKERKVVGEKEKRDFCKEKGEGNRRSEG